MFVEHETAEDFADIARFVNAVTKEAKANGQKVIVFRENSVITDRASARRELAERWPEWDVDRIIADKEYRKAFVAGYNKWSGQEDNFVVNEKNLARKSKQSKENKKRTRVNGFSRAQSKHLGASVVREHIPFEFILETPPAEYILSNLMPISKAKIFNRVFGLEDSSRVVIDERSRDAKISLPRASKVRTARLS